MTTDHALGILALVGGTCLLVWLVGRANDPPRPRVPRVPASVSDCVWFVYSPLGSGDGGWQQISSEVAADMVGWFNAHPKAHEGARVVRIDLPPRSDN